MQNDDEPRHTTPQNQEFNDGTDQVPSEDDPIGTRLLFVVVAMVVLMFIISLGFLYVVASNRPR